MPSEGKPRPIDEAVIATPDDVPPDSVQEIIGRRELHVTRLSGGSAGGGVEDAIAALALGAAARRVLDDQEPRLVRGALRLGGKWPQIAAALGEKTAAPVRTAFLAWAEELPDEERNEARLLTAEGDR
ncbi:hypothetical protein AB4Z54_01515 [Streptomyces sp. MCAF7]